MSFPYTERSLALSPIYSFSIWILTSWLEPSQPSCMDWRSYGPSTWMRIFLLERLGLTLAIFQAWHFSKFTQISLLERYLLKLGISWVLMCLTSTSMILRGQCRRRFVFFVRTLISEEALLRTALVQTQKLNAPCNVALGAEPINFVTFHCLWRNERREMRNRGE